METNMIVKYSDVFKETLEVLRYFENSFYTRIPDKFISGMKEVAKKSILEVKIDPTKSLNEQNISDDCKDMIAIIYYNYIATASERLELIEIWKKNENIYQKKLHKIYNPDNLFDNRNNVVLKKQKEEEIMPAVIEEKGIIKKIIDFIKDILKKKL